MKTSRLILALLTLFVKNPKLFFASFLLGGVFYSYEIFYAREQMSFMGVPQAISLSSNTWTRIFRNDAYMVGYSDIKGSPLWVVYKLKAPDLNQPHLKRPDNFLSDWRAFYGVSSADYTHSGYDRGHMAPNRAISLLYGKKAQEETFLMTNIVPQKPSLNQKLWESLEERELEEFTQKFEEIWVYTGPLFDQKVTYLKNSSKIEVPDAFFKVYLGIKRDGSLKGLALIIPQNAKPTDRFEKYVVSIDDVERRSGFNFFSSLNEKIQTQLEEEIDFLEWFK